MTHSSGLILLLRDGPKTLWKPILNGVYAISNQGGVQRIKAYKNGHRGKLLKPYTSVNNYPRVCLCVNNIKRTHHVHQLVTQAFLGPRPPGFVVNHKDGNKSNPAIENLEYVTPQQNEEHAKQYGLKAFGVRQHLAVLDDQKVVEMRRLHTELGLGCVRIARRFGIGLTTSKNVLNGRTWKHL